MNNCISIMDKFEVISLNDITQNGKTFYFGKVNISFIKNLFTISPAKYIKCTQQISNIQDLDINNSNSIEDLDKTFQTLKDNKMQGYQRNIENSKKISEISKYINDKRNYKIIPNSIIFSLQADIVEHKEEIDADAESFIVLRGDIDRLLIPKRIISKQGEQFKPLLVVDGHHRLLGIKEYYEKEVDAEDIEVLGSFIINHDNFDEAEIFNTVNYKIKPVNKSFHFQLIGEFGVGSREVIFLHYFTRLMNDDTKSPFHLRFKMLGKKDNSGKYQTLTQSFFVQELLNILFKDKKLRSKINEINKVLKIPVLRYFVEFDMETRASYILIKYFISIRQLFIKRYGDTWDKFSYENKYNRILQPLGLGAFIELLPSVYMILIYKKNIHLNFAEQANLSPTESDFVSILNPLFSKEFKLLDVIENHSIGSSQSNIKKLADALWCEVYEDNKDINIVEIVQQYSEWYNKEVYQIEKKDTINRT